MKHWRWPVLVLSICLPVALLASGVRLPWVLGVPGQAVPLPVRDGDLEIAWIHTTTNASTWERFVTGAVRAQRRVPGLHVDDSAAYLDSTTAAPEIVLTRDGRSGAVRIRWYKLSAEAREADWVAALARRSPAPLAFIGGGSTDRAVELAKALEERTEWRGPRPALLVTTATADRIPTDDPLGPMPRLVELYPGRTFRFCFTNRQMADAVLDFVDRSPDLRPLTFAHQAVAAVTGGTALAMPEPGWKPAVFSVQWNDDPYSTDLHEQFKATILSGANSVDGGPPADFASWGIPFSVGGFSKANEHELRTAESIAKIVNELPPQRSLLVLPAVTLPAKRLLRAVLESYPGARRRLVVVTGDGIPANAVLRDGDFAWPVAALGLPLAMFTHADPVGWDAEASGGYALRPPNSTDDAEHFAEMVRRIAQACFPENAVAATGDTFAERLRSQRPAFFDDRGDRLAGSGEYVAVVEPRSRDNPDQLAVWRRGEDGAWHPVRTVPVPVSVGAGR